MVIVVIACTINTDHMIITSGKTTNVQQCAQQGETRGGRTDADDGDLSIVTQPPRFGHCPRSAANDFGLAALQRAIKLSLYLTPFRFQRPRDDKNVPTQQTNQLLMRDGMHSDSTLCTEI